MSSRLQQVRCIACCCNACLTRALAVTVYTLLHHLLTPAQVSGTQHVAFTPEQVADGTAAQTFAEAYGYLELQVQHTYLAVHNACLLVIR
jgi:hypothetical protein